MTKPIQIVDLFAGPGGLGEGFNSVRSPNGKRRFKTLVSVEKEPSAHRTLTLRAFYRILQDSDKGIGAYFEYLQGGEHPSDREDISDLWQEAEQEALQLELGGKAGNHALEERLQKGLDHAQDWVLIGGPPCQAYSVVGRVRNRGNKDYRPEEDKRNFLYREYLDVIAKHSPAIFVMENVKGMLTSRVGKQRIFGQILKDLHDPVAATSQLKAATGSAYEERYTIFSLSDENVYYPRVRPDLFSETAEPLDEEKYLSFVVKAEDYSIPQARHRVILVGVRNDLVSRAGNAKTMAKTVKLEKTTPSSDISNGTFQATVEETIGHLPKLRSGLSRNDSDEAWNETIKRVARKVARELLDTPSPHVDEKKRNRIAQRLDEIASNLHTDLKTKYTHQPHSHLISCTTNDISKWYHGAQDPYKTGYWYNHEARSHMEEDLARYLYCATFAEITGEMEAEGEEKERSPIGAKEIYLDYLAPMHVNWKSGKFADRFKVALRNQPSKTITSHISKDGHYFIHYDPKQCRSLTVREAARLQTFPDDYYFEGNRTQQYVQVGNAVPPLLARRIAVKVMEVLDQAQEKAEEQDQAIQA